MRISIGLVVYYVHIAYSVNTVFILSQWFELLIQFVVSYLDGWHLYEISIL